MNQNSPCLALDLPVAGRAARAAPYLVGGGLFIKQSVIASAV